MTIDSDRAIFFILSKSSPGWGPQQARRFRIWPPIFRIPARFPSTPPGPPPRCSSMCRISASRARGRGSQNPARQRGRREIRLLFRAIGLTRITEHAAAGKRIPGAGIEVLYTSIESLTKMAATAAWITRSPGLSNVPRGAWDGKVIDEIAPGEDEIVLPKTSSSRVASSPPISIICCAISV